MGDETTEPMTPEAFATRMKEIATIGDEEIAHPRADDLLCDVLEQLGYGAGVQVFREMHKWYA